MVQQIVILGLLQFVEMVFMYVFRSMLESMVIESSESDITATYK